jgi:hypothetical protein
MDTCTVMNIWTLGIRSNWLSKDVYTHDRMRDILDKSMCKDISHVTAVVLPPEVCLHVTSIPTPISCRNAPPSTSRSHPPVPASRSKAPARVAIAFPSQCDVIRSPRSVSLIPPCHAYSGFLLQLGHFHVTVSDDRR